MNIYIIILQIAMHFFILLRMLVCLCLYLSLSMKMNYVG